MAERDGESRPDDEDDALVPGEEPRWMGVVWVESPGEDDGDVADEQPPIAGSA